MKKNKRVAIFKLSFIIIVIVAIISLSVAFSYKSAFKYFYPIKYSDLISENSEKYNVEPVIVYAVIRCESSFDKDAISPVNAKGLMQILPETFEWLQTKTGEKLPEEALHNEKVSIKYGTLLLSVLIEKFGDVQTAVAAYHAGIGIVGEWLENNEYSKDGKTLDVIPYNDTQYYVNRVMKSIDVYTNLYPEISETQEKNRKVD